MREKEFLPLVREKLRIEELNPMQKKMMETASEKRNVVLLSPTGSGKTLAFTLPMLKFLNPPSGRVQVVVIAPSRELVIQIGEVINSITPGYKVTVLYGGHKVEDEVNSLGVVPDIVVATPGRLLDHINRRNIDLLPCRMLVLDEFDKCLELGFEEDMRKIVGKLKNVSRIILTSATRMEEYPDFLKLENPVVLNFLKDNSSLRKRQRVHRVDSDGKDKLKTLETLLENIYAHTVRGRTIVFANHRESAERIANYLKRQGVDAVLYHGALDQRERETALASFNNGSRPVLVATDLAARGLDIENVRNVIHYHQPLTPEAYVHRNGRTARVEEDGDIYVIIGPEETVLPYVEPDDTYYLDTSRKGDLRSGLETLYIGSGKREKLSKGDILGFLVKECGLEPSWIGKIIVADHYSLAAIPREDAKKVLEHAKEKKIKGSRHKVSLL